MTARRDARTICRRVVSRDDARTRRRFRRQIISRFRVDPDCSDAPALRPAPPRRAARASSGPFSRRRRDADRRRRGIPRRARSLPATRPRVVPPRPRPRVVPPRPRPRLASARRGPPPPPRAFAVFGYLPEYRLAGTDWNATLSRVTHLALFSLEVTSDAKLASLDRFPDAATFARIRAAADARGARVLVTLGGAGRTGGLPLVAASGPKRALVRTLVAFCRAKALDGVDFNWEYATPADFASPRRSSAPRARPSETRTSSRRWRTTRSTGARRRSSRARTSRGTSTSRTPWRTTDPTATADTRRARARRRDARRGETRRRDRDPRARVALGVPFYARHARTGEARTYAELVRELERERAREEGMREPQREGIRRRRRRRPVDRRRAHRRAEGAVDGPRTARAKFAPRGTPAPRASPCGNWARTSTRTTRGAFSARSTRRRGGGGRTERRERAERRGTSSDDEREKRKTASRARINTSKVRRYRFVT